MNTTILVVNSFFEPITVGCIVIRGVVVGSVVHGIRVDHWVGVAHWISVPVTSVAKGGVHLTDGKYHDECTNKQKDTVQSSHG